MGEKDNLEMTNKQTFSSAKRFFSALCNEVGEDKAIDAFKSMDETLGTDFGKQFFYQMMNGTFVSSVRITRNDYSGHNKITFIKDVRAAVWVGLKHSKDFVEGSASISVKDCARYANVDPDSDGYMTAEEQFDALLNLLDGMGNVVEYKTS